MPTFAEVLEVTDVLLQVEIKDPSAVEPMVELLRGVVNGHLMALRCRPLTWVSIGVRALSANALVANQARLSPRPNGLGLDAEDLKFSQVQQLAAASEVIDNRKVEHQTLRTLPARAGGSP